MPTPSTTVEDTNVRRKGTQGPGTLYAAIALRAVAPFVSAADPCAGRVRGPNHLFDWPGPRSGITHFSARATAENKIPGSK